MSDLMAARLADIHRQFLDAAKRFPHLRLLAVRPHDEQIDWPRFPAYPDGDSLGLLTGHWRELFRQLDPHSDYALKPLDDVWLSIDGALWQAAFYYGGPDVEATELGALYNQYTQAMQEFFRLADLAANHFDMPPDPDFWRDGEGLLRAERSHRWLERLFSLGLAESCDGCLVQVHRLRADVFTASARAVERLAEDSPPPPGSDRPDTLTESIRAAQKQGAAEGEVEAAADKPAEQASGDGECEKCEADDARLHKLALELLPFDDTSADWILSKHAAKWLGVKTETLANRRSKGAKFTLEGTAYGLHDQYCFWCKVRAQQPRYYLPLMGGHAGQLVKTFPNSTLTPDEPSSQPSLKPSL